MNPDTTAKKLILTEEEANVIRDQLEKLRLSLYRTDFNLSQYIDQNFTESQKGFISSELNLNANVKDIEGGVDRILRNISSMEPILIKLPFDPSIAFTSWLKEYLEEKTKPGVNLVIKTKTDRSALAGVLIEYQGRIKNFTVREQIINIFSAN